MSFWMIVVSFVRAAFCCRADLAMENLALRQQLAIYERKRPRPKLRRLDRLFWVLLSRIWAGWRSALIVVKPETVVHWHRRGFRLYWRWKSRPKGRPKIDRQVIELIRQMSRENPTWGAPRIGSELRLLGHDVADSTVAKYMVGPTKPPSPSWKTFLKNHLPETAAIDFFVVPTATFRFLYCFVVLSLDRSCPKYKNSSCAIFVVVVAGRHG